MRERQRGKGVAFNSERVWKAVGLVDNVTVGVKLILGLLLTTEHGWKAHEQKGLQAKLTTTQSRRRQPLGICTFPCGK